MHIIKNACVHLMIMGWAVRMGVHMQSPTPAVVRAPSCYGVWDACPTMPYQTMSCRASHPPARQLAKVVQYPTHDTLTPPKVTLRTEFSYITQDIVAALGEGSRCLGSRREPLLLATIT
jgi:hypothetical protein